MNFQSNFSFLENHDSQLANTIKWAEVYLQENYNICVVTIGQFCELLAKNIAIYGKVNLIKNEKQYYLVSRLKEAGLFDDSICNRFHEIRKSRNDAYYNLSANYDTALKDLQIAYELAIWYYKKFVNPYFIHTTSFVIPSKSIFTTATETFNHYTSVLKQLENVLNDLNQLKTKERNFASDREKITRLEEYLKQKIVDKKREIENRQLQIIQKQQNQSNNLSQQIKDIDSALIRIEMEIDDLKGFEHNMEIMRLLSEVYQRKQTLENQKRQLQSSLNYIQQDNQNLGYSASEKQEIKSLFDELDNLMPNQEKQEAEVKKEIEEKEEEAKSLWLEIDFLHNFATKQNIELPPIPYDILTVIDSYNLRLNANI